MNSLFTCSWQKNVNPITEQGWIKDVSRILAEAADDQSELDLGNEPTVKKSGKKGKKPKPEYERIMGLSSVRNLVGTMTPRYFATKVIDQLSVDHPGKKINEITDEELLAAMNQVSRLSRNLANRPDIQFGTEKVVDKPKPEIKKGKDAFETLNMNLEPGTKLEFEKDTPVGLGLYTTIQNGLKYRVALKEFDGKPINVKDVSKDNIASLVVTDPKSPQTVEGPTLGELEAPKVRREKPVADFPAEGEGDFSGPDPDRKSTRLNSSHVSESRMPSSA